AAGQRALHHGFAGQRAREPPGLPRVEREQQVQGLKVRGADRIDGEPGRNRIANVDPVELRGGNRALRALAYAKAAQPQLRAAPQRAGGTPGRPLGATSSPTAPTPPW